MEQYLQQPVSIGWVLLIVLAVVVMNLGDWFLRRRFNRKKKRTPEIDAGIRHNQVRELVRDAFVNALYNLRYLQKLSYKEHEQELARLRRDMGFDVTWRIKLSPRRLLMPEVQRLKAELKRRRSNGITAPTSS